MENFINKIPAYIRQMDNITKPSSTRFHCENDTSQKNLVAGIFAILIKLYLYYTTAFKAYEMLGHRRP